MRASSRGKLPLGASLVGQKIVAEAVAAESRHFPVAGERGKGCGLRHPAGAMIVLGSLFLLAVFRFAHPIEVLREPIAHSAEFFGANAGLLKVPRRAAHFNQMQRIDDAGTTAGRDAEDGLGVIE